MLKKLKNKKGFTLTELIVVIVIIGILAAVLIPTLTGYITKANKSVDEQKVASLNTLLIEVQVNETDFKNALELKEYLEDEMDYDGDYSLKVEGSYMWYDTLKRKIVIIDEDDDKMSFSTATVVLKPLSSEKTFKFVTDGNDLRSPEGLMQYTDSKKEVWLIGGNGDLFDLVEEIRNIGNSGTLTKYADFEKKEIKEIFKTFLESHLFSGIKGIFSVDKNGNVTVATDDETKEKITASQFSNLAERFHKNMIFNQIDYITKDLNGLCEFDIKEEYNENVKVTIKAETGYANAIGSVQKIMVIMKNHGCELGYIIPTGFKTVDEYKNYLNNIYSCFENKSTEYFISENLEKAINTLKNKYNKNFNLEKFYQVDIIEMLGEDNTIDFNTVYDDIYDLLNIALNLTFDENTKTYDVLVDLFPDSKVTDYTFFLDKNQIKLGGQINDPDGYGVFDIEYTFEFKIADSIKNEQTQE